MNNERRGRYLKLIRWYPASWRARNGDAVVGTLMDADDAAGRSYPGAADRSALVAGALHERFIAPERLGRSNSAALIAAVIFSLWYASVITWSPGLEYPVTLGPFSNPVVLASGMLVVALVLALFSRARAARFVALLSVATILTIGALSATFSWLGPSLLGVVIFAGLGLIVASPLQSRADFVRVGAALFLVAAGLFMMAIFRPMPWGYVQYDLVGYLQLQAAAASFASAFVLAWPTRRNFWRKAVVIP
ncbi:hypothetical protein AB0O95_00825 [Rhodoglobus sp. NPDC076762]